MSNIAVGGNHACGINSTGFLICRGKNDYGKIDVPDHSPFEFSALALGLNHTCALRRLNSFVVCWGGGEGNSNSNSNSSSNTSDYPVGVLFESIVAGIDFTCGLTSNNLCVVCWGEGWVRNGLYRLGFELPLTTILPGPCVRSGCQCGTYIQSHSLCSGYELICKPCDIITLLAPPSAGCSSSIPSRSLRRGLLVYAIVGSVGAFAGTTHNALQFSNSSPVSRSCTIRRQASRAFRRQRSGTSSKHADREEEFTFDVLALATDNFSQENKLGAGSFGVVYKGKLLDGREVAIKRGETSQKAKKFQEKESAFDSELAFLSRLHHKHLVRLVGYCEEQEEKLLEKKAIFKSDDENDGTPISLVDYAVPVITCGELVKILDKRVGQPAVNEAEAVELMAYTAMHCVYLEGRERPTMSDIVANLERAVSLCDDSHGSISSDQISIISE
ncbi:hypothetical protein L1987_35839 [Smallanthus sonchifolius]|uniref:Uncharacterized protein n=1 Tax=Smallanthus sonchifolius TaxID=185202 RepID=A0ACB9HBI2_9ASTR|nr:hypothetical protein L1987_35839 [Smallanthus sonchifolius]